MHRYAAILALAACSIPDKNASDGADAGADGAVPGGPIETQITEAPAEFSPTSTATFEFTSNHPNARFECSVDGERAEICTSPFSRALPDGSHQFAVRATDGNGESDDTPAEHVWTIDTAAPTTTLTEMPPSADNSTMVTFSFTSNENNVAFECSLDNAAFTSCRSGDSFGPVGDGAHAFAVRARDRAGNVDASPAIHAWQVDTSTPDTTLLTGPQNASPSSSATFTFLSPDAGPGATFQCSLDGGPFILCVSPQTYTSLGEGPHEFQVRVRDVVGNLDPTPATRTWTVDLTPPETTITDAPSGAVPSASVGITFTANEDATFTCSLDGGPMTPCTSPFNATNLAQGAHTFTVRATDAAGHEDPSPVTASWTVDTVPPDLMIVAGPADGTTSGPRVAVTFTASEGTTECSVDGAPFAACASPIAYNLPAGAHELGIRAADSAGNVTILTRSWTVACAPPDPNGAAGLLHLDDTGQVLASATGGAAATLGTNDTIELVDPTPIAGRFAGALGFVDSESDVVAWPIGLPSSSELTIELWARPDAIPGTRDVLVTGDGRIAVRVTQDSATTVRFSATVVAAGGTMYTATSAPVVAGGWHWVLVSLQQPTLWLWIDGALTTASNVSLGNAPAFDSVRLGGSYGGGIDEVWLSQLATTSDEAALGRYCPL